MDIKSKKIDLSNRLFIITSLFLVAIIVFFTFQIIYQFKTVNSQNMNQITVSGEGKVTSSPDIATLTLGIETEGKEIKDITNKNVASMNKIIEGLKNLGIESKDIQTAQYSVDSQYNWTEKEGRILSGYKISQNVNVKIRNFTKIGDVLTMATNNGANVVNSLQFSIENLEQLRSQARADAIKQAKEKAETLAKQTGIKLGDIIGVYENNYAYDYGYGSAESSVKLMSVPADGGGVPAQIETGEEKITITVNLTYKIK
jgi:hypothetical protein